MSYAQRIRDLKLHPLKLGMISSGNYQNTGMIRNFFLKLQQLPNYITVLGAGNGFTGDLTIKKLTLDLGFGYIEYNPFHTAHNIYSAFPYYRYSKGFHTGNFATRYNALIKDCDKLIIFQDNNASDAFINSIIKKAEKEKIHIPCVILNE